MRQMHARLLFCRSGGGYERHRPRLARIHMHGQNTCVPAHRFDHVLTLVFGAGAGKIKNDDRAVVFVLQGQLIVRMIAEEAGGSFMTASPA